MLVLSRRRNEEILIDGGNIRVRVLSISGQYVRLGITGPSETSIHRGEVWDAIQRERMQADRDNDLGGL